MAAAFAVVLVVVVVVDYDKLGDAHTYDEITGNACLTTWKSEKKRASAGRADTREALAFERQRRASLLSQSRLREVR